MSPQHKRRKTKQDVASGPPDAVRSFSRQKLLLFVSLGVLIGGIGVVVWLFQKNPSSKDSLREAARIDSGASASQTTTNNAISTPRSTIASSPSQPPTPSQTPAAPLSIKLPTVPVKVTAEELQEELLSEAKQIVRAFGNRFDAINLSAQLHFYIKQTDQAAELWKRSLELNSQHLEARLGLARVAKEQGRIEETISLLREAHEKGLQSADSQSLLAAVLEQQGDVDDALKIAQTALQTYPDSSELRLMLGMLLYQTDQFVEAESTLKLALQKGASEKATLPTLISTLSRQNKGDEAASHRERLRVLLEAPIRDATSDDSNFNSIFAIGLRDLGATLLFQAGVMELTDNNVSDAQRLFLRSVSLNPRESSPLLALAEVFRRQRKIAECTEVLKRVVELHPDNLMHAVNLANLALQQNDVSLAESTLERASKLPDGYLAQALLVRVFLNTGRLEQARAVMDQVLEKSQSADAYILNSMVHKAMGNQVAARAAIVRAKELAPNDPRLQAGSPYVDD